MLVNNVHKTTEVPVVIFVPNGVKDENEFLLKSW